LPETSLFKDLQEYLFSESADIPTLSFVIGVLLAAICAHLLGRLYIRCGQSLSNRARFAGNFVPMALTTMLVISIVKSSLALSLGMVGALSIVRFRAAIKEPEEIVYLFFCIAVGIALGARYWPFAVAGTAVFALFVAGGRLFGRPDGAQQLLLTITGRQVELPGGDPALFTRTVAEAVGPATVQRFGVIDGEVQYRIAIPPRSTEQVGEMVAALRSRLPSCRISYINVKGLL
jgi:hypothetical protein